MIQAEAWKEILEILPPLIILIVLAFSPGAMRFIQKKILLYEERKKRNGHPSPPNHFPEEEEIHLSGQSQTNRLVSDTPDQDPGIFDPKQVSLDKENKALEKIDRLSPLRKAVVWAEILGPPKGKSPGYYLREDGYPEKK